MSFRFRGQPLHEHASEVHNFLSLKRGNLCPEAEEDLLRQLNLKNLSDLDRLEIKTYTPSPFEILYRVYPNEPIHYLGPKSTSVVESSFEGLSFEGSFCKTTPDFATRVTRIDPDVFDDLNDFMDRLTGNTLDIVVSTAIGFVVAALVGKIHGIFHMNPTRELITTFLVVWGGVSGVSLALDARTSVVKDGVVLGMCRLFALLWAGLWIFKLQIDPLPFLPVALYSIIGILAYSYGKRKRTS